MAKNAALAAALTSALAQIEKATGMDRKAVAAKLNVDVSTVGRWATGERSVPIEHLPAMDAMCEQPRGYILRLAGFVEDSIPLEAAIQSDPALTEVGRATVLSYYRFVRDEYDESKSTR